MGQNQAYHGDFPDILGDEDSAARKLALFLYGFRRFVLEIVVSFLLLSFIFYWIAPDILYFLQLHLDQKLAFFGVMEPIVSLMKIACVMALMVLMPWILFRITQVLVSHFGLSKGFGFGLVITALLLFYLGAAFCFFITLPFGINFLLGYQSEHVRPVISVGRFVNFVGLFLLGFGLIFELPLIMTVSCRLGLCSYFIFKKGRRYAILIIAILAAILTPTPDVINMALMGLPLYLLYELGIVVARLSSPK